MISQIFASRCPSPGACLDDLLASRFLPRRWTNRIWSSWELSEPLERCARSLPRDTEWRAHGEEGRILFTIARAHKRAPQLESSPAIDVYFLDDNASVYSAGVWEYDFNHGWWLDAVLDLSYDCEHGWWVDGLIEPDKMDPKSNLTEGLLVGAPPVSRKIAPPTKRHSGPRANT